MDKLKVFQIATVGLLLLNIVLMAFIFFSPPPRGGGKPPRAVEHFGFDEVQNEQFRKLVKVHQRQMRTTNDRQSELLQTYFLQLTTDSAATPDPLPPGVATLEQEKINSTYQHFLDIKKTLRPEQQAAFPGFIDNMLQRILLKKSKNPPPPPRD